jgi:hypothetical protein
MNGPGIDTMWADHVRAPFPPEARGAEVEGVDLVLLDSLVSGCISSLVNGRGARDTVKVSLLSDLLKQIQDVLPHLTGESRAYFSRLKEIANAVVHATS